jgi:hypothetical protein
VTLKRRSASLRDRCAKVCLGVCGW